ncbi:hypothetical protein ACFPJ1_25695 [Kribbella qitaiheensis]|uniref:rhamnogalacturonan lyase family protein n=1 Tax=Kribbella qitaiheensis TaxID=1544730 RepID=UPI003621F074
MRGKRLPVRTRIQGSLMHDVQYREEVARQNTAYNQPSYTGFYLASDLDWSKVALVR